MKRYLTVLFPLIIIFSGCDNIEKDDIEPASFSILNIAADRYNTEINLPITVDFLKNDSIKTAVTVQIDKPVHGEVKKDSVARFIYYPKSDFEGTDSFEYTVCNAQDCQKGIVEITVSGPDSPQIPHSTEPAVLRWTGEYEVDGCGFIIIIGTEEYKAKNEPFIHDEFKILEDTEVLLTYKLLNKEIEVNCGDRPDPLSYRGIEIIEIK